MPLNRIRGMEDLSGDTRQKHNFIIQTAREAATRFCFKEISTPLLESTHVFARTLGEHSDIVHKEMFTFEDRSGNSVTLRPEGTAGIVRHFITEKQQQNLPLRFFYHGPMFRYERPQKGRLRQFHSIGMEFLGEESSRGDIECLTLAWLFLKKLNLHNQTTLQINSIGDTESRKNHQTALLKYLQPLKKKLSETSQKRLNTNPLRILDSKEEADQEIIKLAPTMQNFLNKRSLKFFEEVTTTLTLLKIPWKINPRLVRGLDYYSHSVFEFTAHDNKLGMQNTVLAGGRYDQLVEILAGGGDRVHGVGWAAGIERLAMLLTAPSPTPPPITLVPLGEEGEKEAMHIAWELREAGFSVYHPKPGNLNKKMKKANQLKSPVVIIFGPEEIQKKQLAIKNMQTGEQESIARDQLLLFLKKQNNMKPSP